MAAAGARQISKTALRRSARRIASISAICFFIGGFYTWVIDFPSLANWHRGAISGVLMAASILSLQYYYVHTRHGAWLHRLPFSLAAPILGTAYLGLILLMLTIVAWVYEAGDRTIFPSMQWFSRHVPPRDVGTALGLTFFTLTALTVNSLLGAGTLRNLVAGKYHTPQREDRIALFLDMRGSTALAEKLGDTPFYELLRSFILDTTEELIEHGGTIDTFVGDGIIAHWPPARAGNVLPAILAVRSRLAANAKDYEKRYGTQPRFRAAIHCGAVIVGEVGAEKRQIVAIGDFVNVTARIEDEGRRRGLDLLASDEFLNLITLPEGWLAEKLGDVVVRGREQPVRLSALSNTVDDDAD
ncbi:MAG: adenylate/guanylate cyclase domain-containing protein [Pseudomonadota bacterium]